MVGDEVVPSSRWMMIFRRFSRSDSSVSEEKAAGVGVT